LTFFAGKLYLDGNQSMASSVVEIDPASHKSRVVREGGGNQFPPIESQAPSLSSITHDDTALIVSGQGYIWRLTKDGKSLSQIAGTGPAIDFPRNYNPAGVYPAKQLVLRFRNDDTTTSGSSTALVWNDGGLYWRGRNVGAYVVKIGCQ
jgi:hypothetical protein